VGLDQKDSDLTSIFVKIWPFQKPGDEKSTYTEWKTTMWMNNSNQPCLNNGFDPTFRWDFRLKEDILIRFFKKTAI
jgi:hypothetical protein